MEDMHNTKEYLIEQARFRAITAGTAFMMNSKWQIKDLTWQQLEDMLLDLFKPVNKTEEYAIRAAVCTEMLQHGMHTDMDDLINK